MIRYHFPTKQSYYFFSEKDISSCLSQSNQLLSAVIVLKLTSAKRTSRASQKVTDFLQEKRF